MSFEDFATTCSRSFAQTPIRLIRMSSSLTTFVGCTEPPYRHLVILCQPQFTETSISIVFYLNGTAYFEYLNEEKIRQRLKLLNNSKKTPYHKGDLAPVLNRLKTMLAQDSLKQDHPENELHAKLLSSRLLSIEIIQNGLNFKFRCDERPELFEQHYVRQLLIQVKELAQRQTYLCELLEHKDELPEFDSKLFLNTPMTLVDDQEDDEEDADILSTSTTGRLWKWAFNRRGGPQCLDICLLKKAYNKALEDVMIEEENKEIVSGLLTEMVDKTIKTLTAQGHDDAWIAMRIAKRSFGTNSSRDNDKQQLKRLRGDTRISSSSKFYVK